MKKAIILCIFAALAFGCRPMDTPAPPQEKPQDAPQDEEKPEGEEVPAEEEKPPEDAEKPEDEPTEPAENADKSPELSEADKLKEENFRLKTQLEAMKIGFSPDVIEDAVVLAENIVKRDGGQACACRQYAHVVYR